MGTKLTSDDLYAAFSPTERLTLALEASARRDGAEVMRLGRTCPRKVYRLMDPQFGDRLDLMIEIGMTVTADLNRLAGHARATRWALELLAEFNQVHVIVAAAAFDEGVAFARGEPRSRFFVTDDQGEATTAEPPQAHCEASQGEVAVEIDVGEWAERSAFVERRADEQATKLAALLLARERDFAGEVAVVRAGFARFCREQLGVEPDGLIKSASAAPGGANPGLLAEYPDLAPPDGARVEAYFGRLCATFRRGEEPARERKEGRHGC